MLGDAPATTRIGLGVGRAEALGALVGDPHHDVTLIGVDRDREAGLLAFGEFLFTTAQDGADAVQRVTLAATVAVDVLLDPSAHLVHYPGCPA